MIIDQQSNCVNISVGNNGVTDGVTFIQERANLLITISIVITPLSLPTIKCDVLQTEAAH